jgi:hypothetical protein
MIFRPPVDIETWDEAMAANNKRPPDDDLGYEVVENPADPGYEVVENPPPPKPKSAAKLPTAKLLPPLPPAKSNPPRPAPKVTVKAVAEEDPGFEVVSTGPPTKPKSKAAIVVDDDEDVLPVPKKSKRAVADDEDEDDLPRKKKPKARPVAEDDDGDDDRPRKKKGKKGGKGGKPAKGIDEETNSVLMEWAPPLFMILVGLILTCVGMYGIAKNPQYGMAPGLAIVFRIGIECVTIPITIVALIFIGSLFGIEYGSITSAIRNLAAMGFLSGGLVDIFEYAGLPDYAYHPIIFLLGVGLFMSLFGLDVFETMVTMFMLGVMNWLFGMVTFFILLAMLMSAEKKREREMMDDPDDRPSLKQKDRPGGKNRFADPDDGFDPDDN